MCGIIAVVRRQQPIVRPSGPDLLDAIKDATVALRGDAELYERLDGCAESLGGVDTALRSVGGVVALVEDPSLAGAIRGAMDIVDAEIAAVEASLDAGEVDASVSSLERINARLIDAKDAAWAIGRDRLRAAEGVVALAGPGAATPLLVACFSVHQALSAVDRLEVRGRDSAGIEILVSGHGLDVTDADVRAEIDARGDLLFKNGAVRVTADYAAFVYKAAFEIGELGDNTAALRAAITEDSLLRRALSAESAHALVLGHTRWASVGIISEPNAHPQSSDEAERTTDEFVTAVLNGDVDNHADLVVSEDLSVPGGVTTDAKVIPAMMARRLDGGLDAADAFRETVTPMEGSVAIAANAASDVDRLFLALRGSGQALYVGLADDAYIVASEPYGVVEETSRYLRMDGETPSDPENPTASRGQILELDATRAGSLEGIRRLSYDGSELPLADADLASAEITTRDIDRGDFPHYLLKEITDAPGSFRKTLRGKLLEEGDGRFSVHLPSDTLPDATRASLADGSINRVQVIGQGTAAVAGQSLAHLLADLVANTDVRVEALPATELSGFRMREDMSDTLVVAISQSGTTTDTNRTVDLVRGRGATVIAIVNRRNSDLCDKSDGVLYTSDGRDVEMSVASTKAFYAQIAAGMLLASSIAAAVPGAADPTSDDQQRLLAALHDLPDQLTETISRRAAIAEAARTFAPSRRYWAIVGNGSNQIAARELRIKMSELCYKSIACDATEDKKHIDLSAEPMIFVCAAGLVGSTADDVGKEVAIYRAHKAAPIVVATDGDNPYTSALAVLSVPHTDPRLAFVLSAMVGHLFGYEAALAIDAQALPLRAARGVVESLIDADEGGDAVMASLASGLSSPTATFMAGLHANEYDGNLEAGTAVQLAATLRYATGVSVLDTYQSEFGKVGTPRVVLADLTRYLSNAIDELTRPVDAIKHQAKTVTVGISRSDESLFAVSLVADTFAAGAPRDRLSYSTLKSLADLDAAVAEVTGYSRYRVENAAGDDATAVVIDRGGIAVGIPSRTDTDPRLRGTKHLVARERELMVARGRKDGRMVLIVPETKDGQTTGLTLMHLQVHDRLPASTMRNVLSGYRRRYQALRDAVTETEDSFRDDLLAEQSVEDLLCLPILDLADRWRS